MAGGLTLEWWSSELRSELSQGDIIANVPFCVVADPLRFLRDHTLKAGRQGWAEVDTPVERPSDHRRYLLGHGIVTLGVVLSHDCELDKDPGKGRVIMAPMQSLGLLDPATRHAVIAQRLFAMLPLPEVGGQGDQYADLRLIDAVPRTLINGNTRLASMSDMGRARLQAQLAKFFLRLEPPG